MKRIVQFEVESDMSNDEIEARIMRELDGSPDFYIDSIKVEEVR